MNNNIFASGRISVKAYLAMFAGLLFMSNSAILVKFSEAPGIVTTFYRMAIGAVVLLIPFLFLLARKKISLRKKGVFMALLGGIAFGLDMGLWSTGVVLSNATVPTLVANLAPLWVGLGSMYVFGERHSPGFWVGLLIAFTGIPLLLFDDFQSGNGILKGALLGIGAGIFYAAYYLFAQEGRKWLDTLVFLTISTTTSAIVLLIMMVLFDYNFTGYSTTTWMIFLSFGIGIQVIGWLLISFSQGFLPASIVAPTLLGQPVITAILATTLLHEQLTFWHWLGGAVVLTGIYIVHYSRLRKKKQ
ncbi:MAG: DMT family transporter [Bacteroidota bacterium]